MIELLIHSFYFFAVILGKWPFYDTYKRLFVLNLMDIEIDKHGYIFNKLKNLFFYIYVSNMKLCYMHFEIIKTSSLVKKKFII